MINKKAQLKKVGLILIVGFILCGAFVLASGLDIFGNDLDKFPSLDDGTKIINFTWTDNNTNEEFIIYSDYKFYSSETNTIIRYLAIDNTNSKSEKAFLKSAYEQNKGLNNSAVYIWDKTQWISKTKQITDIEEIKRTINVYEKIEVSCKDYNLTKEDDGKCYISNLTNSYESPTGKYKDKEKELLSNLKYVDDYLAKEKYEINLVVGMNYLKIDTGIPFSYEGEFFDELFGEYGSYGHLDPFIQFDPPTLDDSATTSNNWTAINITINESNLETFIYNWNGTNFTFYNDSLVLMMNFDNISAIGENSTHVVDVSQNGNNGTFVNDATWVTSGKFNGAVEFDGVGDYIEVPDDGWAFTTNNFTINLWVNRSSTSNQFPMLIGQGKDVTGPISWVIFYYEAVNDNVWFSYYPAGTVGSRLNFDTGWALPANEWHYLTFSRRGTSLDFFADGIKISSHNIGTSTIPDIAKPLIIGSIEPHTANYNFKGIIDEVRIWNKTFSDEEINQSYMSNLRKYDIDLWEFYVNQTESPEVGLADGTYTYQAWAEDTGSSWNTTGERTITIGADTTPPTYSNANTNITISGEAITFNVTADDDTSLETSGQYNFSTNNTGVWINDSAINFTSTPQTISTVKILNSTVGNYVCYKWYLTDNAQNENYTAIEYCLTTISGDTADPYFTFIPANASLTYSELLLVNFTADDDVGIANFTINWTDYFSINNTGTLINSSILPVGIYEINVSINDTSGKTNQTSYRVTINQNGDDCGIFLNDSATTYGEVVNVQNNCTSDYSMYLNGSSISNNTNYNLGVGVYNFSVQRTDDTNYSNIYEEVQLVVFQDTTICGVWLNETSPIDYLKGIKVLTNCSSTYDLYLNGSSISNNTDWYLGAGLWNFIVQRIDTTNYSHIYEKTLITVDKITPTATLTNSETWTEIYLTEVTIGLSESNTGDGDITYTVWRDDIDKSTGETVTLGVGTYDYKLNSSEGANYSATDDLDTETLTITKFNEGCSVLVNESSPITYGVPIKIYSNCSTAGTLAINGSTIANNSEHLLGGGAYNFSFTRTDQTNYTDIYNETIFAVNRATTTLSLSGTSPITYGTAGDVEGTNCPSGETCNLYTNITGLISNPDTRVLGTGVYLYTYNKTETQNWTSDSEIFTLIVNNATPSLTKFLNGVDNNLSIVYPAQINVSAYASAGTIKIYRNGTDITSENFLNISLSAGYYQYEFNITGDENNSDVSSVYLYVEINKSDDVCGIQFNETSPLEYPNVFNVSSNCTSGLILKRNDTIIGNNTQQSLAVGVYNFSVFRNDTINYTNIYSEREFIIKDSVLPFVQIDYPTNTTYTSATQLNYTYSDTNAGFCWYSNNSGVTNQSSVTAGTNFTGIINQEGLNNLTLYCNDTTGNENRSVVFYTIDSTAPTINFDYPTQGQTFIFDYTGWINISIDGSGGNCSLNDSRWNHFSDNTTHYNFVNVSGFTSNETIILNVSCWDSSLNNGSSILTFTSYMNDTAPTITKGDDLMIWRNQTNDVNVSKIDKNGNWWILGIINSSSNIFDNNNRVCTSENGLCNQTIKISNSTSWNRSGTNVFLANSGDKVGIGTISPDFKLQVNGTIAPETTDLFDIGSLTLRWLKGWFVDLDVSNNVSIGGNLSIDGSSNTTGIVYQSNISKAYAQTDYHNETDPLVIDLITEDVYENITGLHLAHNNSIHINGQATIDKTGMYHLTGSVSFSGGNQGLYRYNLFVNNQEEHACGSIRTTSTTQIGSISINCLVHLVEGDQVNMRIKDTTSPVQDVNIYTLTFNMVEI